RQELAQVGPEKDAHSLENAQPHGPRGLPQPPSPGADAPGFSALSPMLRTFASSSDICTPLSDSKRAGTCAAILVRSPVTLFMPAASPLPVDTTVMRSTLPSGEASARTTSGMFVMSLSMTAAWLYS